MAYSKKYILPLDTEIEVIAKRKDEVYKKIIKLSEIKTIKKKKGWSYGFYKIGFSQYKNAITE